MALTIPESLAVSCRKAPDTAAWLQRLPDTIRDLQRRWLFTVEAPLEEEASASWVAPAELADGTSAVLKVGMPHMEAEHELEGLRYWDGDPTVRLLEADADLNAMLLEHCKPGTLLRTLAEPEQDVVIAGLLRRLWRTPTTPHPFRPLTSMLKQWGDETLDDAERWLDAGLVREGLRLFQELPRSAPVEVLLATDLHAGNVLRAQREPWLVIDPKPFVGDPAYDATQHLFNCSERLRSNPDGTIRHFAGLLGVDHERVRLWTFARAAAAPGDDWKEEGWATFARAIAP
jgi:streptomycin 6-kinase